MTTYLSLAFAMSALSRGLSLSFTSLANEGFLSSANWAVLQGLRGRQPRDGMIPSARATRAGNADGGVATAS